jgi:hypothetical protein
MAREEIDAIRAMLAEKPRPVARSARSGPRGVGAGASPTTSAAAGLSGGHVSTAAHPRDVGATIAFGVSS